MQKKKPTILVMGMLNTKGAEIRFLADQVRAAGGNPLIMEISCGAETAGADIPVGELTSRAGFDKAEVFKMDRVSAQEVISRGGALKAQELLDQGKLDGVVAHGGATTTYVSTKIMRELPIGIPKVMSSTLAAGNCQNYVESHDIAMFYPIVETGLNRISKRILTNVAGMVVGAASTRTLNKDQIATSLIACTVLGVASACTDTVSKHFETKGYDVINIHGTGGGTILEKLIRQGEISALLDLSTHEITDLVCGSENYVTPDRLTAAAEKGIPQVISTAGLDLIGFPYSKDVFNEKNPRSIITGEFYKKESETIQGRALVPHTPSLTLVEILPEEAQKIAENMIFKLNGTKGPTALVIPMRGWSRYDIKITPNGTAGPGWEGGSELNSNWSKRSVAFIQRLSTLAKKDNPNLDILLCDVHINEPNFVDLLITIFQDMLEGKWKKGKYEKRPFIRLLS